MKAKFLSKKVREEMVDDLVSLNVDIVQDDGNDIDYLFRKGFVGYDNLSDSDVYSEFQQFFIDPIEDEEDEYPEVFKKARKEYDSMLADVEIKKMLKSKGK